ncbi:MAG: CPBP family intramembrane metalloprotease [Candidatus Eisenbacteria bacterium]|nr:CPBP family intramembrane metalloprotease [Candidatus Eisenbacteria bacterium]
MPERLTRRDAVRIVALLALILGGVLLGARLFPRAFPEASIDFALDRAASETRARELLAELGYDVGDYLHAARFAYDPTTKVFLERGIGLTAADSAFAGELRLWRWAHRWFRPLQRESFRVEFATSGALASFTHRIAEDAPAGQLDLAAARALAAEFLQRRAAVPLDRFRLVSSDTRQRPARTDRTFTWERRDRRWAGAPLRVQVTVHGDRVGRLRTTLEVPESWRRDYAALRSRNETTGVVAGLLYGLLLLAIAVTFVRRMPRGGLQWRPAFGFAAAGAILLLLGELNGFESALFGYDTHQSLPSYLAQRGLSLVVRMLGVGLFLFVLTAGSEVVYREAYPEKIALGGFFSRRGVRTRRFFYALLVGYALTALFFAYQAVFYLAAGALGAWAPADVPYDELLEPSLPWAVVLLVGFFPAVTEEFSARMFAIPWLTRHLRSHWLAVLLAAALWGFAHAGYPNQPFYIRGVEVGLAGVLVGVVLLRLNVLAVLVWHFTVDAFYAAFLLLRSGNIYYLVSGALAAGLLLLPLLYATIAYLRAGGFRTPEGLRNRDLPSPAPPAPPPSPPPLVLDYAPLSPRRWGLLFLVLGVGLVVLHGLPLRGIAETPPVRVGAADARALGRQALRESGAPVESLQIAVWLERRLSPETYRYGLEHAPAPVVTRLLEEQVGGRAWSVRAFAPLRTEEWRVVLSAVDGRLLGFEPRRAEAAPGAALSRDAARRMAEAYARTRGVDADRWRLMVARSEPRPARRDHEFIWEATDPRLRLGEGAVRAEVRISGDRVSGWRRSFKLPQAWRTARENRGVGDALRVAALGLLLAGGLYWTARRLLRLPRLGPIRWRRGLQVGLCAAAAELVALGVGWEALLRTYDTSRPWSLFLVGRLAPEVFGVLLEGLLIGIGVALVSALYPRFWPAVGHRNRRRFGRDALLGALVVVGALVLLDRATLLLPGLLPGAYALPDLSPPPGIASRWAFWPLLGTVLTRAGSAAILTAGALFLLGGSAGRRTPGVLLLGLAMVAFLPEGARTAGELAAALLSTAIPLGAALLLARYVLRENPLAYLFAILVVAALPPLQSACASPVTQPSGALLGVVTLGAGALFLLRGRSASA